MSQRGFRIGYFGCWDESGHFFRDHNQSRIDERHPFWKGFPADHMLDGGVLFFPPEKVGTGAVTYLHLPNITLLAWWGGNPWDKRGAVCQVVVADGKHDGEKMWRLFEAWFPKLSAHFTKPQITEQL